MQNTLLAFVLLVIAYGLGASPVLAKPQAVEWKDKTYHVVTSIDPAMDTGKEVCESIGKKCVGYTSFGNDVCMKVHPTASVKSDGNGSKAGFYCDGRPQGGICASEQNTCHVCPNCDINASCVEPVGSLYREMYVECSPQDEKPSPVAGMIDKQLDSWFKDFYGIPGRWWGAFRNTVARSFDQYRDILGRLTMRYVKFGKVQVTAPDGSIVEVDIPSDSLVCEFYQQNKKMVTCGALAAADQFCVKAFDSRFARAELCQDDGVIVCSKPCTTNPQELKPQRCAFDAERSRGNQAPPIDLCTETKKIKVDAGSLGTKKAGEVCAHGGECGTGICLGQPSDSGIKYFCSCKQTSHDYTCGK